MQQAARPVVPPEVVRVLPAAGRVVPVVVQRVVPVVVLPAAPQEVVPRLASALRPV